MTLKRLDLDKFDEADISFGPWRAWSGRSDPPLSGRFGGLYLLAFCPSGAPQKPPTIAELPREVIYVGDAKNLKERPLSGAHNRLERYVEHTNDRGLRYLYVAVAPLYETNCADYERWRICSLYLEAMLIWRYTKRHGHPPLMRYKEGGEGGAWIAVEAKRLRAQLRRKLSQ